MEVEKRRRINVALWAYAYELMDDPIVDDGMFDMVCKQIDLKRATDNAKMDIWFIENFSSDTGQWIHAHPDLKGLGRIYRSLKGKHANTLPPPE